MIPSIPHATTFRSALLAIVLTLAAPMAARGGQADRGRQPADGHHAVRRDAERPVNPGGLATSWRFIYRDNPFFLVLGPLIPMPLTQMAAGRTR